MPVGKSKKELRTLDAMERLDQQHLTHCTVTAKIKAEFMTPSLETPHLKFAGKVALHRWDSPDRRCDRETGGGVRRRCCHHRTARGRRMAIGRQQVSGHKASISSLWVTSRLACSTRYCRTPWVPMERVRTRPCHGCARDIGRPCRTGMGGTPSPAHPQNWCGSSSQVDRTLASAPGSFLVTAS
jgi:hypothetical protein